MKALLIDPVLQMVETITVEGVEDIAKVIGFDSIIFDETGTQNDRLYFDEDCFLRGTRGRFQLDKLVPVAGKGIIIGGIDDVLQEVAVEIDDIRSRLTFLD